jgi:stress response protein SCP2
MIDIVKQHHINFMCRKKNFTAVVNKFQSTSDQTTTIISKYSLTKKSDQEKAHMYIPQTYHRY